VKRILANLCSVLGIEDAYDATVAVVLFLFGACLLALPFYWSRSLSTWSLNDQGIALAWLLGSFGLVYFLIGIAGFAMRRHLATKNRTMPFMLTIGGLLLAPRLLTIGHLRGSSGFEAVVIIQLALAVLGMSAAVAFLVYETRRRRSA
jgi:hypothetical protein